MLLSAGPGWDTAQRPAAEERGSSQATEGLITDPDQGQPCGNCAQLTEDAGGSTVRTWFCYAGFCALRKEDKLRL